MRLSSGIFALSVIALTGFQVEAQTWQQDSLAVRLFLDQNALSKTTVESVAFQGGGRVLELQLDSLKINNLTPEFFQLTALRSVSLANNLLDSIPVEIAQLTSLTTLNLSGNNLSKLPSQIGSLSLLTQLNLRGNLLTALPASIVNLTKLLYLDIGANPLLSLPSNIDSMANLSYLYADQDSLSTLPENIARLGFLKVLVLANNKLSSLPSSLGAMDSLETLDLSVNQLSTIPAELVLLSNLKSLDLGSNVLCSMTPALTLWANTYDPNWKTTQSCVIDGQLAPVRYTLKSGARLQRCGDGIYFPASIFGEVSSTQQVEADWMSPDGRSLRTIPVLSELHGGESQWKVQIPAHQSPGILRLRRNATGAVQTLLLP